MSDTYTTPADLDGDGTAESLVADSDGDGACDTLASDTDGDGYVDSVVYDTDADGYVDTAVYDTNADGASDVVVFDTDGDGVADSGFADTDYDGTADTSLGGTSSTTTDSSAATTSGDLYDVPSDTQAVMDMTSSGLSDASTIYQDAIDPGSVPSDEVDAATERAYDSAQNATAMEGYTYQQEVSNDIRSDELTQQTISEAREAEYDAWETQQDAEAAISAAENA